MGDETGKARGGGQNGTHPLGWRHAVKLGLEQPALSEKNQRHKPHNASHHVRIEQFEEQRAQSPSQSRSC